MDLHQGGMYAELFKAKDKDRHFSLMKLLWYHIL